MPEPAAWPPAIPPGGSLRLHNCTLLPCFTDGAGGLCDLTVADGVIAQVTPAGANDQDALDQDAVDLDGAMIWPCFADLHTHLDKGHIGHRATGMDGRFASNLAAAVRDREAHWTAADLRARMTFGLRCAYAHGTHAVRTHIDSPPAQADTSWAVFREMRQDWAGRIQLQGVALIALDELRDHEASARIAAMVASSGGVLGAFIHPLADLEPLLDRLFALAERHGLDLDLHVDETGDPDARGLHAVAAAARRRRFAGKIVAGHCCSLALQGEADIAATLELVAAAGIAVVSLPLTNLHMQDRQPGRTPRWRGVTLLHEFAAHGVAVALASDNVRDPFYAYGDHDLLEVLRIATLTGQLDYPVGDWPAAVTTTPARLMGLNDKPFTAGQPADFVLLPARSHAEMMARPQSDRVVFRAGRAIARTLPDFRELDGLT